MDTKFKDKANDRRQKVTNQLKGYLVKSSVINKIIEYCIALRYYLYNNCITHIPLHIIRICYLRNILHITIGKSTFVHLGSFFRGMIKIGNNTVIGRNCTLIGDITINNNVSITAETYIFSASHFTNSPTFESFNKPVIIEDYAFIGARAMILPGVKIGKGAILGAASTATKNIPDYSVYAGSPAREIGRRTELLKYNLEYSPFFQ